MVSGSVRTQLLSQHCLLFQHKEKGWHPAHCLSHSLSKKTSGASVRVTKQKTNVPDDQLVSCLSASCALENSDFCCRFLPVLTAQRGAYPSHRWLLCLGEHSNSSLYFFISKTLPEARKFTSDSELPQSLRTCRTSSQPPSQIHIQCNLDPVPVSKFFFGKSLNSGRVPLQTASRSSYAVF